MMGRRLNPSGVSGSNPLGLATSTIRMMYKLQHLFEKYY